MPAEEAASAAMAMDQLTDNQPLVEADANIVVYDDQPSPIETPRAGSETAADSMASAAPPNTQPATPFRVQPGEPVPEGMILYPRRSLYLQGLLLAVVAIVFFGTGYLMGRGDAQYQSNVQEEQAAKERVLLDGTVVYNPGTGRFAGDQSAVVMLLPEGKLPKKKMKAEGIRPRDPPLEHHPSIRTIREELGGAFARTDASGNFSVMVPQPGKYYLLIISQHADRPRNADIDEADLAQIQQYFNLPQALIGRRKYYWALKEIHIGASPIEHGFGRDGQQ